MIGAGHCDGGVFMPHTIIIPPGFPIESLTIFVPGTSRTVSPGSTQNISCSSSWFVNNKPNSLTRRNAEIFVSVLMFEDRTSTADDVCPLEI